MRIQSNILCQGDQKALAAAGVNLSKLWFVVAPKYCAMVSNMVQKPFKINITRKKQTLNPYKYNMKCIVHIRFLSLFAAMRRGALIRVDVLCKTEQMLTLKTETVSDLCVAHWVSSCFVYLIVCVQLMMMSGKPETFHHLRFEAPLDPNPSYVLYTHTNSALSIWRHTCVYICSGKTLIREILISHGVSVSENETPNYVRLF